VTIIKIMKGFIYILTSASFPYVKIGMTKSDPSGRAKELSDTSSLPFAFELAWFAFVEEYKNAERLIHDHFAHLRVNPKREFFELTVSTAIKGIKTELDIAILYEESSPARQSSDFEAAYSLPQEERWKHFDPPSIYPFQNCPDCKKKCLGLLDQLHDSDVDLDEEAVHWAVVIGSIVRPYPEGNLSPDAPLITYLPRQGP
jgi:hypothetical protein